MFEGESSSSIFNVGGISSSALLICEAKDNCVILGDGALLSIADFGGVFSIFLSGADKDFFGDTVTETEYLYHHLNH